MKIQINKVCVVLSILVLLTSSAAFCKEDILPSTPKDLYSHAKLAYNNKDYKTALKLFRTMQEDFPMSENAVRGWEYIAQCENQLGNQYAAFEAYQQIWDNHKDFGKLSVITRNQMQIANYYLKVKRYKYAIEIYQKILENAPFSESAPAAQYSLAEAYIGAEDFSSAKLELKKVIEDYPSSQLVDDAAYKLGYVNYLESEAMEYDQTATEDAVIYFRRFIHNFPSSPKVGEARKYIRLLRERIAASLFRKGEFYYNIRASKAAVIQFQSIIDRYPDTKYAALSREFLADIKAERVKPAVKETPKRKTIAKKTAAAKPFPGKPAPKKVEVKKNKPFERPYTEYKKKKQLQIDAVKKESEKDKKIKELLNKVGKEELHEYVKNTYYLPEIKRSRIMAAEWKNQKALLAETSLKETFEETLQPETEELVLDEIVEEQEKPEAKEETSEGLGFIDEEMEPLVESALTAPASDDKIKKDEPYPELAEKVEEILTEPAPEVKAKPETTDLPEQVPGGKAEIDLDEITPPQTESEIKVDDTTFEAPETKIAEPEIGIELEQEQQEDAKEEEPGTSPKWKTRKITGAGNVRRAQVDKNIPKSKKATEEMLLREFRTAYDYIQQGDATRQKGLYLKAKVSYEKALDILLGIQRKSPVWESDVINFRINYCREILRGIE